MSSINPKILNKIKKCLALGASPNPHEAAAAMRQANTLMKQHGVEAHHVHMSEIGEHRTSIRTMSRDKPAHWEVALAAMVGKAFGCQLLISRSVLKRAKGHLNEGEFLFIGQKAQAEIAAYTTSVLSRKCKASRQKWIAEHRDVLDGVRKSKVTRLGDAFAEGWVHAISKLVSDFANPPEVEQAIERYVAEQNALGTAPTRGLKEKDLDRADLVAARAGVQAAQGESIYRPMMQSGSGALHLAYSK